MAADLRGLRAAPGPAPAGGASAPSAGAELDPALLELHATGRRRRRSPLHGRDRLVTALAGGGFALAAAAAAALSSTPDPLLFAALVAAFAAASRIEFEVGTGAAIPVQAVFVPMALLLPLGWVPAAVACGYLLSHVLEPADGQRPADRALVLLSSSWFAFGPVAVFTLLGRPDGADGWLVLLLALVAQFAVDAAAACGREWLLTGVGIRRLAPALVTTYAVDALLAPPGLLAAGVAAGHGYAFLLVLPAIGLLAIFAAERRRHIDHALDVSEAYRGMVLLLGDLIDRDDAYTGSHSRQVVDLVVAVADELGLSPAERRDAEYTALLHDVGKITIPDEILNKPGALTREERTLMETHTVEGERILARAGGAFARLGALVRACHERWDGDGYPDRLAGEEIPLIARIVCACDAYNAMTTDRPYRAARPAAEAAAEIVLCAGTQFDAEVAAALVRVVGSGGAAPLTRAA